MRRPATLSTAAFCILAAGSLAGAVRQQQAQPTFSTRTTLLTLDVTALDRDGNPVSGLTADDFEVKVNGKIQRVQAIAYLEAPRSAAPPKSASSPFPASVTPRRTVTNPAPKSESRLFVILVDDLSFEAGDGKALFVSAERFVSSLPASDYVGYGTTSGAGVVNPTLDRQAVVTALKSAVGAWLSPARVHRDPPFVSIGEALMIDGGNTGLTQTIMLRECFTQREAQSMSTSVESLQRMSPCAAVVPFRATQIATQVKAMRVRQLQAYTSAIESLRAAPGIKHMVVLTNGLAFDKDFGDLTPVARAAASAGVELSTMVQDGDIDLSDMAGGVEGDIATQGMAERRRNDNQVLLSGVQTMTDMAGGQFYRVIGQPKRFFDRVDTSASAVYRLGVELPPDTAPGRELAVTARVKRADVAALASHHAAAPVAEASVPADEQMRLAVQRGETRYGVPIDFGVMVRRGATAGQLEIAATVRVPAATDGPLSVMFGFVDSMNALKSGKRTVPVPASGDYQTTFTLPAAPGAYSLRLAVADAAGHVGAVVMPIQASLASLGSLQASDVMTWVPDAAGQQHLLAFEEIPADVSTLTAMVELYAAADPPAGVVVKFAILDSASRTVVEKDATISAGAGMMRADAPLDVSVLPSGPYVLRASVSVSGQPAGTLTTTLRKK